MNRPTFFILLIMILGAGLLSAADNRHTDSDNKILAAEPSRTLYNVNRIAGWIFSDGTSGNAPTGDAGVIFPRGTTNIVFIDGLIWGGYVRDNDDQNPRIGGQDYRTGTQPGHILVAGFGDQPPVAADPNAPRSRIYRIRRDYAYMTQKNLRADAAEIFMKEIDEVTLADMNAVRDQYEEDWNSWPYDLGAPFYDDNSNGIYEPELGEEPGLAGADQVIWFACNDLDAGRTASMYGSHPMGIELQVTIWAYHDPFLQDVVFKRYRLINKSGFNMDSLYVSLFLDTDIGYYADDLAGCDTSLQAIFGYNSSATDDKYDLFGLPPAAAGYTLLQGPIVESEGDTALFDFDQLTGYRNLGMTSHFFSASGSSVSDPAMGNYSGTLQYYNGLRGYQPTPDLLNPLPWIIGSGPDAGKVTKFPLSGDPLSLTGDVDGQGNNLNPGDRRTRLNSGPFTLMDADTQEVVVALAGGIDPDGDHVGAISDLRQKFNYLQQIYPFQKNKITGSNSIFSIDGMNTRIDVQIDTREFTDVQMVNIKLLPEYGSESAIQFDLNDDGINNDAQAGDGVWSGSMTVANRRYPFSGTVSITHGTGSDSFAEFFQSLCLRPPPTLQDFRVIWENGRQDQMTNPNETIYVGFDILNSDQRNSIDAARIFEAGLLPDAVAAYIDIPESIPAGQAYQNNGIFLELTGPAAGDSLYFNRRITFDQHSFIREFSLPIEAWERPVQWGDTLPVTTLSGFPGRVVPVIADPALLTGHTYRLSFSQVPGTEEDPEFTWQLYDITSNAVKWTNGRVFINTAQTGAPVIDGIIFNVISPSAGFSSFQVVANSAGLLDPPDIGCFAFNQNGFPLLLGGRYPTESNIGDRPTTGIQQSTNSSLWGIHTGMTGTFDRSIEYFNSRTTQNGDRWPLIVPYDFEIRFTYQPDNWGLEPGAFNSGENVLIQVPFELWNVGVNTIDDPDDDYRLFPYLMDTNDDGAFGLSPIDHYVSGGNDDPETDWIYWVIPADISPGESGYMTIMNDAVNNTAGHEYFGPTTAGTDVMRRMVLVNWNGGDVFDQSFPANVNATMPEPGTVFRILTNKPVSEIDTFEINTAVAAITPSELPLQFELQQNFPNPFNLSTQIRFSIPYDSDLQLTVYNILGQRVITLADGRYSRGRHTIRWAGRDQNGRVVSSGVYVYKLKADAYTESRKMVLIK